MGGIPNEASCSLCHFLRTSPPKGTNRSLWDVKSAWCGFHGRKLFEHGRDPEISFTVCSKFKSVYWLQEENKMWPSAPLADEDHLWLNRPSNDPPFWIHKPFVRFDELPKVNADTGEEVAP
jgi:hypothetical protein